MKRIVSFVVMTAFLFACSAPLEAQTQAATQAVERAEVSSSDIFKGPVTKLGRGISNVVTSPFEMLLAIKREGKLTGAMGAMTIGILRGLVNITKRVIVGAYEVATFPIPLPAKFRPILTDPEYLVDKDWKLAE